MSWAGRAPAPSTAATEFLALVRRGLHVRTVHAETRKPFRFLFCGDPALVAALRALCLFGHDQYVPLDAAATIETIDPARTQTVAGSDIRAVVFLGRPGDADGVSFDSLKGFKVPIFALTVNPDAPPAAPVNCPANGTVDHYTVAAIDQDCLRAKFLPHLVSCCKGVEIAVGRRLPGLREAVAVKLTRDAANAALKVAAASAVVDNVPLLGFVLGAVASAGDMVAITGIQVMLVAQIGSVYGKDPDMQRVWELLPVVGGGFGWRMLARELAGFIPVAGVVVKGAIAYAGTTVVGESVHFYYQHGRHMSKTQAASIYSETKRAAIEFAKQLVERLRKR